jgi:hypothetical protein
MDINKCDEGEDHVDPSHSSTQLHETQNTPKPEPNNSLDPIPKSQKNDVFVNNNSESTGESDKISYQVLDIQQANDEIAKLLLGNRITMDESSKLQSILRENAALKEKVSKLKALLARSAKAGKDSKNELEAHRKLLDVAKKEVERLNERVESLANRPTHMDLLADFETNFDRALMNLNTEDIHVSAQSGGEPTAPLEIREDESVGQMMAAELVQTKARLETLENMNAAILKRSSQLEKENEELKKQNASESLKMNNLQLELRMARMETDEALRNSNEKTTALREMQLEIDLVTKSAMEANARAAEGLKVTKNLKSDRLRVEELEAKVLALEEWARASSEAKSVILEQNKALERKLSDLQRQVDGRTRSNSVSLDDKAHNERHLWTKTSSLVIGAGALALRHIELGDNQVMEFETVILKWKFDITPNDQDIVFSILKGRVDEKRTKDKNTSALIRNRVVLGGGGGEVENPFILQNTCTLVFSNEHSWIRPRAVKYQVEAFAHM